MILPDTLKKGDTIGLAFVAGPVIDEKLFVDGVRLLKELGFSVRFNRQLVGQRNGYLAASDQERADDLTRLWRDPEVKAIMAVRGGYGCLRLLPLLDFDLFKSLPKFLIGFSDVTALLTALYYKASIVTLHGPNVTTLAAMDELSWRSFLYRLTGKDDFESVKPPNLEIIRAGRAIGPLIGGNLACLVHLLGTGFMESWKDHILVLEDINEPLYKIDRMLQHLKMAGFLEGLSGLILGEFINCESPEEIWRLVDDLLTDQDIPVWGNFPVGHGGRNLTLPIGGTATMDSAAGVLGVNRIIS